MCLFAHSTYKPSKIDRKHMDLLASCCILYSAQLYIMVLSTIPCDHVNILSIHHVIIAAIYALFYMLLYNNVYISRNKHMYTHMYNLSATVTMPHHTKYSPVYIH